MNDDNWRKSTYSSGQGGQCVEVGQGNDILVRDSKDDGNGPLLRVAPEGWTDFLRAIRA